MVHSVAQEGSDVPGELVARLEVASEGSRELDYRIAEAYDIPDPWIAAVGVWPPFMPGSRLDKSIPEFTTSLDAAFALAERVAPTWRLMNLCEGPDEHPRSRDFTYDGTWSVELHCTDKGLLRNLSYGSAPTPALALCIAILKATTASAGGDEGSQSRSEPQPPSSGRSDHKDNQGAG